MLDLDLAKKPPRKKREPKPKKVAQPSVKQLKLQVELKVREELEKWDDRQISLTVKSMIEKHTQQVILKLLGFDARWADRRWELDHCNGRAESTAAGQFIISKAKAEVEAWLEKALADGLPSLPKSAIDSLRNDYHRRLQSEISEKLRNAAENEASRQVQKTILFTELDSSVKEGEEVDFIRAHMSDLQLTNEKLQEELSELRTRLDAMEAKRA